MGASQPLREGRGPKSQVLDSVLVTNVLHAVSEHRRGRISAHKLAKEIRIAVAQCSEAEGG